MAKKGESARVPRLRFPEFRGTGDWNSEPMSRLYKFMRNNALSRDKLNYVSGTVRNIHYGDIHTKFPALFDITHERVPFINGDLEVPNAASEDYCAVGDVILADASEDTNDVGKSMEIICLDGEKLLSGLHTILARPAGNRLALGFAGHLFRSAPVRARIEREAQGTKVFSISPSRLGKVDVDYPENVAEQQKIAGCLTSLDEVIAVQGRKVKAFKAHKRGLMQQLFPREGETVPRLRFPEFRDTPEWNAIALGELLERKPDYGVNAPASPYSEDLPTYLRITDIDEYGRFVSEGRMSVDIEARESDYLRDGDIALARTGASVGKSYRYRKSDGRLVYAGFLIRIRPDPNKIVPSFLSGFLMTQRYWDWVHSTSARSGQPGINASEYNLLPVPVPHAGNDGDISSEQKAIADCLSALDLQIASASKKLTALKSHKHGLMQQLFPAPQPANS